MRTCVDGAQNLLQALPTFDPKQSTRKFRIACTVAVVATLLQPILQRLVERAPSARLQMLTLDRITARCGLTRGDVDLIIGVPPILGDGHKAEVIYRDPMACILPPTIPGCANGFRSVCLLRCLMSTSRCSTP